MEGSVCLHLGRHSASSCEVGIHTFIRTVVEKKRISSVGGLFCPVERACAGYCAGDYRRSVERSCTIQTVLAVAGILRESLDIGVSEVSWLMLKTEGHFEGGVKTMSKQQRNSLGCKTSQMMDAPRYLGASPLPGRGRYPPPLHP